MKSVLCFGDSNTYGYRPTDGKRYPYEERWTGLLQEKIGSRGYRIIEEGLVGRTTVFEDALREGRNGSVLLPTVLESHDPIDTVILMLGTNDCKTLYKASSSIIGKGVEILIGQILRFDPEIKILLASPIHLGENVWKEEFDPEFDAGSVRVSKELKSKYMHIAAKYGCDFVAASDYAEPSREDEEHLTGEGHRKLAEIFFNKLIN